MYAAPQQDYLCENKGNKEGGFFKRPRVDPRLSRSKFTI
jgi:hypothetical protein